MRKDGTVYLMYHEIERAGVPLCHAEPGYLRYVVHEADFRGQIHWMQSAGMQGISVLDALEGKVPEGIVITFDDGCETDLTIAAPVLRAANFGATFYITFGFLGRPGYLRPPQVRELSDAGFDIGCHSLTHPYLSDLGEPQLNREIAGAKAELEQIVGRPVQNFSCPGGRWNSNVATVARNAGYRSVATSRIAHNFPASDTFRLGRIAVMRGKSLSAFQDLCSGHRLWQRQLRNILQTTCHQILGNTLYDRLRGAMLARKASGFFPRPPG
jgi:peptidoglycan/xylan/chitin deacetylase (PgdA/CDA1 family)